MTEKMAVRGPKPRLGRAVLLPLLLASALTAIYLFHLDRYLTFEALGENRSWLLRHVAEDFILSLVVFAAVYIVTAMLSLPGSFVLTMAAGFLFGTELGTVVAVLSATTGATLLFAIARTSHSEFIRGKSRGVLTTLREGFRQNELSYLLFLRLIPLFPFWLINLACAFLDVTWRNFILGTALGIIPGAAVYASVGSGLGVILERGQKPDLGILLSPTILLPLIALAFLSLAPILYQRLVRKNSAGTHD